MYRMKRVVAIALLVLAVGVGTPQVFAEGPTETPGYTASSSGPTETPGRTGTTTSTDLEGPTETPGFFDAIFIYLVSNLIP
jgi:hypothetical protein